MTQPGTPTASRVAALLAIVTTWGCHLVRPAEPLPSLSTTCYRLRLGPWQPPDSSVGDQAPDEVLWLKHDSLGSVRR